MAPKKKAPAKKETKVSKPKKQLYKLYDVSGDSVKLKTKLCPKCGSYMANHSNRFSCGKCKYTEKKESKKKE